MSNKISLGRVKDKIEGRNGKGYEGHIQGESISLEKHSFDCGWYWGFGYIGNRDLHTHFDGSFLGANVWYGVEDIFVDPVMSDEDWWTLKGLFKTAYTLKDMARVYHSGGHCSDREFEVFDIRDAEKEKQINAELKEVLDSIWKFIPKAKKRLKNKKALESGVRMETAV